MWKHTVRPRFGDIDGLRHINNCVPAQWFEIGREPLYRFFHPDLDLQNWTLIMAKVTMEYVSQMRLGADVEIRTYVKRLGRSSITTYQEGWQDGTLGCKGDAVLVHYDFVAKKSMPIPDAIRAALAEHLVAEDHPHSRTRSGRLPAAE